MEHGGVGGFLQWLGWQLLAMLVSMPLACMLLCQVMIRPCQTLRRKNRDKLQLPDPLPGLVHEWIEGQPGIRLHAVRTSKGSGRPLMLLLHGFPEAWHTWRHQMAALRGQYEVVALDLRGYGLSSKPTGWQAYHQYPLMEDLLAATQHLLREAGQRQLVLAGHDWGGHLAWCLAYAAPNLFSALITLCIPHPGLYHANRNLLQRLRHSYVLAFQLPWLGEAALCAADYSLLEGVLTKTAAGGCRPGALSQEYLELHKQAFGRPGAATAALNYYRAVNNPWRPTYKLYRVLREQLHVPTLMLWGGNDANLSPVLLRGTDALVPRLRLEVLPLSSHWMQHDCPEQVNRLIKEYLQQQQQGH